MARKGLNDVGAFEGWTEFDGQAAFGGEVINHDGIPEGEVGVKEWSHSEPAGGPVPVGAEGGQGHGVGEGWRLAVLEGEWKGQ